MDLKKLFNLENKNVALIGGSGLIGSELVRQIPYYGARIIVGTRNQTKSNEIINNTKFSDNVIIPESFYIDISNESSIKNFFNEIKEKFGKIDALINSAWPKTSDWHLKFENIEHKSLYKNLCDHAGGYFLCCQAVSKIMKDQKSGVILNMGSIYGEVGPHFSIYEGTEMTCPSAYPLIKGGIHTFTKYLAAYLAPYNIRVNCISSGGIIDRSHQDPNFIKEYIKQTPLGRMGEPSDILGPVIFMLSDASLYVTGQILFVDGGWTCW